MLGQSLLIAALALATVVAANHPLPASNTIEAPAVITAFADEPVNYRLPNNTRPLSYDIHLTTHIHTQENFNFSGKVAIRFVAVNASKSITLHQRQLNIGTASLVRVTNPDQPILIIHSQYDSVTEFLTYYLTEEELTVDSEYILTIEYTGIHRSDDGGFYRSSYISADGSRRWLATTQFESTNARHGFPCYDEPALRAFYTIRITHGSIYHAISNMPAVSTTPNGDGYTTTTFEETAAPTPSYLIAFIVSDFASKTATSSRGLVQRIFSRPNAIEDTVFSLDTGIKIMDAFEEYFQINYTFPKMDQVAVPDFAAGAMENWGLVTYRESRLLYNENVTMFSDQRAIATVIGHEYLHQWFGNLVTPKWWNYIWLSEGFARLMESYATNWVFPEWKYLDTYVFSVLQSVMITDGTSSTRPMTYYVESPQAISNLFDTIAYAKSSCVIRMVQHAVTEETFRRALTSYLKLRFNSAATEEDLFGEIDKAAKADKTLDDQYDIATIFSSWSRQAGFPVVSAERNYANTEVHLSQERYLAVNESTPSSSIWWIPYTTASSGNIASNSSPAWFNTRNATVEVNSLKSGDWFLLNKLPTGYYRVKYDLQNYKLLSEALIANFSTFHLTTRSQLIDDAFDLARTERLSYDVAFDFIKYLEHELEYVPWASAFRALEYVERLYASNVEYHKFANYILKQLNHLYTDAGLDAKPDEHIYRKQARLQTIQLACRLGGSKCLDDTNDAVNHYLLHNHAIHQDHRAQILCGGVRNATETQYKLLIAKLGTEEYPEERNRFIDALACTSNVSWAQQYLEASIGDEPVYLKSQADRYRAFSAVVGASQNSTRLAIQFLKSNFDAAASRYGTSYINSAISRIANFVVSEERTQEFNELLSIAETKTYITSIGTARNTVNANRRWLDRNEKVIEEWIRKNGSSQVMVSAVLMAVHLVVSHLF